MESTGKYWVPVFNILEKRGIRVVIANPKWVKAVKGNKDDTKDSNQPGQVIIVVIDPAVGKQCHGLQCAFSYIGSVSYHLASIPI